MFGSRHISQLSINIPMHLTGEGIFIKQPQVHAGLATKTTVIQ